LTASTNAPPQPLNCGSKDGNAGVFVESTEM